MATNLDLTNYDPAQALNNPIRTIGPALKWQAVVADTDFGTVARWLKVTTAGNLDYIALDGTTVTGFPVLEGYHFMLFTQVLSSSTAAGMWWSD
jgi:hypothetical protein